MKRFQVVGFGALNWDDNRKVNEILLPGMEDSGIILHGSPGGSAANTVAGLSRLGVKTAFLGAVGKDEYGKRLIDDLKSEKIKPLVLTKNGSSGVCLIISNNMGERSIYVFPEVNDSISFGDVFPYTGAVEEAEYFHTATFACVNSFKSLETQLKLACKSRNLVFSPGNIYSNPEGMVRKKKDKVIQKLLGRTNVLFLNDDESRMLTGENDYAVASKILIEEYGMNIVALTLGNKGCYIRTRAKGIKVSSFKPRRIADTTGAGDAFAAGFLFGLVNGKKSETCGKIGNYLACRCIEEAGARKGLPFLKELPNI